MYNGGGGVARLKMISVKTMVDGTFNFKIQ